MIAVIALVATTIPALVLSLLTSGDDRRPTPERWMPLAEMDELARRGVIYDEQHRVFLVHQPRGPIALFALSPHSPTGDERVLFCPSSGWFEASHGERFDRRGVYADGPASRGLDQLDVRVQGRRVEVNVAVVYLGEAPGAREPLPARGPHCQGGEGEPGFFEMPGSVGSDKSVARRQLTRRSPSRSFFGSDRSM